ncbi:MAG: DUF5723 family protein [Rhodothermales bacterium]
MKRPDPMNITLRTLREAVFSLLVACLVTAAAILPARPAAAQTLPYTVSSLATAGAGPSAARDHDAIFVNPANLVYNDRGGSVVMSFMPFRLMAGGNLVQFGFYNDGLQNGTLTEDRKHELLDNWFGPADRNAMRFVGVSAGVVPFALVVRGTNWGAGFAAQVRSHNRMGMNRGLVDLALRGMTEVRTVPLDAAMESMNSVHLSFAYSRRLPARRLAIGIAPRIILGTSYAEGRLNSTVDIEEDAIVHHFDYSIRAAGSFSEDVLDRFEVLGAADPIDRSVKNPFGDIAGRGAGIDLGITYDMRPNVAVAISLTDLGFVKWSAGARRVTPVHSEFRFEGLDLDLDRIDAEFDGQLGDYVSHVVDSLANDAYGTTERRDVSFITGTPAVFHTGGTLYFANRLGALSAGASIPLNEATGNLTRRPAAYMGVEYRLGRRYGIPLRAGVRLGGSSAVRVAAGIGLHTPIWEFGISAALTPDSEMAGGGMRVTVGVSLLTFRF